MARVLARLRSNLDFMPSPVPERPGLLVRDPYQYSDATLIIPPVLASVLDYFDGSSSDLDLRQALVQLTGDLRVGDIANNLLETLANAGFLEDETYARLRDAKHRAFEENPVRPAAHAGAGYPSDPEELRRVFGEWFASAPGSGARAPESGPPLCAVAAPHVSPAGGWQSYRDAYLALGPDHAEKVFVVLGTSHYGEPDRFGLTRKIFSTPLGDTRPVPEMVGWLASQAPDAVIIEDYCHSTEHSIEFQVAFLQFLYGPSIRVLPILCGPFLPNRDLPEQNEGVRRFLAALQEFHVRHQPDLLWVLGIDMAHMGRRYGDPFAAHPNQAEMLQVSLRDRDRIGCAEQGDPERFWSLVAGNEDDLKWCGSSPLYTFLRAVPEARARLLRYQQWQIDPQSVVSFAALTFQA